MNWSEIVGDWGSIFNSIDSQYLNKLINFLNAEYNSKTVYPDKKDVFKAFKFCKYNNLKAIWLFQDPYFNGRANGIALANNEEYQSNLSPSLESFYDAMEESLGELILDRDPTLEYLSKQGVLFLNSYLTVLKGHPLSHKLQWTKFTRQLLTELSFRNSGIIYYLCGKEAKSFKPYINSQSNYIFETEHPAAAKYNIAKKWNCDFKKVEEIILKNYDYQIDWFDNYIRDGEEEPF